ncbi:hypothetical protein N7463_006911 [Penicillium fimorum]|uniref:GPI anchored protein n=1 Tax=Penicillium fimorum TaxID=1882269 RepID=A0A9X0C6M1_9EURO|nr:hypothetical protein N7463_006911 [Penicillium fimorum]
MLSSLPSFTTLALSLLLANLATSTITEKDEPQLFSNVSRVNTDDAFALFSGNTGLNTRELTCGIGYLACEYDSSRCCSISKKCCGNGFCAKFGETCCTGGGTCPIGFKCCAGTDGCAPLGGECCSDGSYCRVGKKCRTWRGEKVCCSSLLGCVGENDGVGSDDGIGSGGTTVDVTSTTTTTEAMTTTYVRGDWDYYYTTIYWTYWFYYWTSSAPYTIQTVTSTKTRTRTIWSVYATNGLEATSSLEDRSSSYTYFPPYSATSLKSSTDPLTLSTGATATARAAGDVTDQVTGSGSSIGGASLDPGTDAAVNVGVSRTGILGAILAAIITGLAFGL